ncbi:diguanylate cyclase domain-containing protein [Campylobacter canadensis]|uniref:Diguanylate cyclase n=1 Tax=Campylobacter canadensis TaxID=449520 RepID=A0ABS7WU30_9BACT|nr:diguanylate cyclase [Campylobacter canadensis]MBZ7987455.1 diguanylate cyclase [Campylobacter canadensis]MBZ7995363.1 diguanylate cyclase [Campylobacter canadensis]MBZ7996747.1 diguanylate cyclase [Campylobacter canadensis]MBZ7998650.1 diguanylate cyclase [Campylobacter canadensis]MBZ8000733.1 diguanylate cyclase [Campylobacter canadensis]
MKSILRTLFLLAWIAVARFTCAAMLYNYNNDSAALTCTISGACYLLSMIALIVIKNKNLKKAKKENIIVEDNASLVRARYRFWYVFQLETLLINVIIVSNLGWGWGFDFYILALMPFYYLNARQFSKIIFFFPLVHLSIYFCLYFFTEHFYGQLGQFNIYIVNGIFAIIGIFILQFCIQLDKVIKYLNDENRKLYLERLVSNDTLTNTLSKYSFLDIVNIKFEYASDENDSRVIIAIFEITNLQNINEEYGNEYGNAILIDFSHIIKQNCINYEYLLSRWSGDEFLLFISDEDEDMAQNIINEIKKEVYRHYFINGIKLRLAVGVSKPYSLKHSITNIINEAYKDLTEQRKKIYKESYAARF